ncbi:MAG TPA: CHAT domain-containing protein [Nitrospiraceae bacterium]|nr:CHAT domain-containing protein [Nitrospiraceae bacterium]
MQQGASAYQRGAFDQALTAWKEAAQRYEEADRPKDQSRALVQAAQAAQALGHPKLALQQLDLALALAQQVGQPAWTAQVLDRLGRAYLSTRQFDASAQFLGHARDIARTVGDPALTAAVLNDLGILRSLEGHYDEALVSYRESLSLAQTAGQDALANRARVNAARAALRLGHHDEAQAWLDAASQGIQALPPSYDKASALISLGTVLGDASRIGSENKNEILLRAAGSLQEAAAMADQQGDGRTASYAWGYLGRLYESEHRYEEAARLTRRATFSAQAAQAPESLYRWQWQLGRILASLNQLDEALASYRTAVHTLEPIRPEVALSPEHAGFGGSDSLRPLYVEYADLLLHRAARMDEGEAAQGYLKAARDAVEASKAVELRDYFRDECVDALHAQKRVETVSATTAVLYPIVFPDRLELLVSLPGGLKRLAVDVSASALSEEVRRLRQLLEKRTSREYLPHAQRLYDWLVRPWEPDFAAARIDTLVVVPDGPLRTIPMAALHDGRQFLIRQYAVATTPGLYLTDPQPFARERVRLLASGLTEATQGFPPLPHVAGELTTIRSLYGGDQLLNKTFVTGKLEQELKDRPISVLHIASHGRFDKDVAHSFVLTYDDKLTMERLDQYVGLFKFRRDPLELLTLSACETAAGDERAALGLAGVAIKAGARSALATLWSINDAASSKLVGEFYRQLSEAGVSKAVALQRAQMTMMSDLGYEHPAYWSPFLLLNNWL